MDEKSILNSLNSKDNVVVVAAIKDIKKNGSSKLLTELLAIYTNTDNADIIDSALDLLNDLHDQNCEEVIVDYLNSCNNDVKKKQVVSSCWQSAVNYSNSLTLFSNIFVEGNLETAIEAFSVIDNCVDQATQENVLQVKEIIESNYNSMSVEKQGLADAILDILK